MPLRVDRLLGDRDRRGAPCCGWPAGHRAAAGRGRRGAARRRGRLTGRAAALDHVGRWLGIGLAGLVNIFNPRAHRARRAVRADLPVRPRDARDTSSIAGRSRRPARIVRVVPAMLGEDAPLLGAAELAFEPLLADPAAWLVPRQAPVRLATA